jgi:hypothetical protein
VKSQITAVVAAVCLLVTGCANHGPIEPNVAPSSAETSVTTPEPEQVPVESDPPTGQPFEVSLTYELTVNPDGTLLVVAQTNLPDGAELMAGLFSDGYHGQDKSYVDGGVAEFGPFGDGGGAMPTGSYELSISLSMASLQSAAVRNYIGESGELMTGPHVVQDDIEGGFWVDLNQIVTIT